MVLERPLSFLSEERVFRKYCGFLELSLKEWEEIQARLLEEQLALLRSSEWGRHILGRQGIKGLEEFRCRLPLTTYDHYASHFKDRDPRGLPAPVEEWAFTLGPRGTPKWVPYTRRALGRVAEDGMAVFILAAASRKGQVLIPEGARVIYNVAPPPYLAGLIARAMQARFPLRSIPPLEKAEAMDFLQRVQAGFQMALRTGADVLCAPSSVLVRMGEYLEERSRSGGARRLDWHPLALFRQVRATVASSLGHRPILPRDLWRVKAVVAWGLDTSLFKSRIAYYWGREPLEFEACTEAGIIALQSWTRKGMTPVPHAAFLEFLPEEEALVRDHGRPLHPLLLGEVEAGKRYEVVVTSFYGMPFVRYRTGHLVRVLALGDPEAGVHLPQLQLVGRSDDIIDLAGFARLDEKTLWEAISRVPLGPQEWTARKEVDGGRPVLAIYMETPDGLSVRDLEECLHENLKTLDPCYQDLETMLGLKPIRVIPLSPGTFQRWVAERARNGGDISALRFPRLNASPDLLDALLRVSQEARRDGGGPVTA